MLTTVTMKDLQSQIRALHASPVMVCAATAGATGEMLSHLWRVPGSSDTIVDFTFLSHRERTLEFVGVRPEEVHAFRFCSESTALRLAANCYWRARGVVEREGAPGRPVVGLGMTATCATSRPQRGAHRVHIAIRDDDGFRTLHAEFDKDSLDRERQGKACDLLALNMLLRASGCGGWDLMEPGVTYPDAVSMGGAVLRRLPSLASTAVMPGKALFIGTDGAVAPNDAIHSLDPETDLIYPGSFRPLHHGHLGCADLASRMTGKRVVFQMTSVHPDKGIVPVRTLLERAEQFRGMHPVLLMHEGSLYVEKARMLPRFHFLIGADAAYGILNPRYYDGEQGMLDALATFRRLETRFHVIGRVVKAPGAKVGVYRHAGNLPCPRDYHDLFLPVSGRWDISSTELRNAAAAPQSA